MHVIPVTMNWKTIHLPQQHRKKLIPFYAETAAGNSHFRNTKKAAAITAMQDSIRNAVYMRIFISAVKTNLWKIRTYGNLIFQIFFARDTQILYKELWYNRNTFAIINIILRI